MLGFWICGFAFAFGGVGAGRRAQPRRPRPSSTARSRSRIGGNDLGALRRQGLLPRRRARYDVGVVALFLFQMVFMDTTATIPTGAMAERWKFSAFMRLRLLHLGDPVPGLRQLGLGRRLAAPARRNFGLGNGHVDFAGSGVVHMIGGWCALAGAIVLGPRIGKYNKDGSANPIPGHNRSWPSWARFILAFGWFGFNPGSTLGASGNGDLRIGIVAVEHDARLGPARSSAMLYTWWTDGKPNPGMMVNGLLAGLVAITAPSGFVSPIARRHHRRSSPASWSAWPSRSSNASQDRRPGRRDLRPRRQRPVGRARGRPLRRRHRRTTAVTP